jgi:sugar phosphate isomerase/epimerase
MNRRNFLLTASALGIGVTVGCQQQNNAPASSPTASASGMQLGLVTYQWAKDWDLPTILSNCEKSGVLGVELRTEHKHGVEPTLSKVEREEVKKRFADSPVTLVGYGANCEYHSPDPEVLKKNIEQTKEYVQLMADCGGSGVKVKPNTLPADVPREKTIEQIGKALNEVGAYAADFGQKIRVEVHGRYTQNPTVMKEIFDVATHPNVYICWNSNDEDLANEGLEANFRMLRPRFGDTVHVRELNLGDYPYDQLMKLFLETNYKGWILLEARTEQTDMIQALKEQNEVFKKLISA